MNLRSLLVPRYVWGDGLVIGAVVVGLNVALAPRDLGWLTLNPTPYLLIPLLLGARYGFGPGVISALGVCLGIAGSLIGSGRVTDLAEAFHAAPYVFVGLVLAGAVAGELWLYFRRRIQLLEANEISLRGKVKKLNADAMLLREAKDELDRMTAARDGEISSLDAELRRLYACSPTELPEAILSLLKRQVRVSDAALYRKKEDEDGEETWVRFGLMGRDDHLPLNFEVEAHPLVAKALSARGLVTLPEIVEDIQPAEEDILLATPLTGLDEDVRALLLVAGMPFVAFTPASADLIDLVCGWCGGVLELAEGAEGRYRIVADRDTQKVFFEPQFVHQVTLAFESCKRHRLPSSIVELGLPEAEGSHQSEFEKIVLGAVRSGDFVTQPKVNYPALRILLPLAGERGTDIFVDRCTQFCIRNGVDPSKLSVKRVDLGLADSPEKALAQLAEKSGAARG